MRVCGRLCDTEEVVTLTLAGGRIAEILPGELHPDLGGPDLWLSPGFLDLQVNGYRGFDFAAAASVGRVVTPEEYRGILKCAAAAGTPLLCPTLTTSGHEALLRAFESLGRALDEDPWLAQAVPGLHLEGPYISSEDGPRGAHPREHARDPDWDEFQRLQEASGGRIRLCTLAPEREGALPFIERLAAAGVVPALGHTGAIPQVICDAVSAGARMSTHLGNGAHAMLPRHPNYLWEQLAADGLVASVIADGDHLPAATLKTIVRAKTAERLVLVSDAISLGGMPPGLYDDGLHEVTPTGMVRMAGTPYLAGAGHLLDWDIAHALRLTDLSLAQAVSCATSVPARVLGLADHKGYIAPGFDADLTLFRLFSEGPLQAAATLLAGEVVYRRPATTPSPT
ncbi:MAG TPA: amidohydrolase family protein [Armatimonadota bacterium]|jgi:N-acetylglucosamine-6-phosphate deacetylase